VISGSQEEEEEEEEEEEKKKKSCYLKEDYQHHRGKLLFKYLSFHVYDICVLWSE